MFREATARYGFIGMFLILFLLVFCGSGFAINAPGNLKSTASCHGNNGTVMLSWSPVSAPAGHSVLYSVYYSSSSKSGPWSLAQQVNSPSFTFTGDCSTDLYFKVRASEIDPAGLQLGESVDSEIAVTHSSGSDIPLPQSPLRGCNLVPPVLTVSVDPANPYNQINLSWTNASCGAIRFDITRSDGWATYVSGTQTTYHDTALVPGTTYRYQVHVRNYQGKYEVSNWASTTTR
ncbi:MAG: fibronectin type III domain-containing protein [Candidatus Omnitrophica bacterium]|nr:fibronectin type III domain-containing protein [Candidatus Omnitrophota bacterium]